MLNPLNSLKQYKFGFDIFGLLLFLTVMIPNLIWFAVPAPHDILRNESITPVIDTVGSVFQVLFICALCVLIYRERNKLRFSPLIIASVLCVLVYFAGWIFYYRGLTNPFVILSLTLPPCLAFLLFAWDRKNFIAVTFAACFTVCHLIYGVVNFIG